MSFKNYFLFLMSFILIFQTAAGAENEYGIVKAWFNGQNATANGVELKIGETADIKVDVISKISGDVIIQLYEPGVTKAFEVIDGPSMIEKRIDNMNIQSGWSKTYTWKIAPNGAWKGGNAPINIFVQFYKGMNDKKVDFTIANPYILDEQYSGAPTPETTASPTGTPAKATPSLPVIFTVSVLLLAWRLKKSYDGAYN